MRSLGQLEPEVGFSHDVMTHGQVPPRSVPLVPEIANLVVDVPTRAELEGGLGLGSVRLRALRHAAVMSETPVRVGIAPGGLNSAQPQWLK